MIGYPQSSTPAAVCSRRSWPTRYWPARRAALGCLGSHVHCGGGGRTSCMASQKERKLLAHERIAILSIARNLSLSASRAGWAKYTPDSSTGQSELVLLRAPGQYNLYVVDSTTYKF